MKVLENYLVTTPWHDRENYLRIMYSTLFESMRGRGIVTMLFKHKNEQPVPAIASTDRTIIRFLDGDSCHQVYVDIFNYIFKTYEPRFVVNIDADMIVHPQFFDVLDKMLVDLPDMGMASFFNESNHPEPTDVVNGIYHLRKHVSFCACVIRREAWEQFKPPQPGEEFRFGCADGMFSTFVTEQTQFKVYSTIRSYAEHLGFGGQHAGNDIDGLCTAARGRRFYS